MRQPVKREKIFANDVIDKNLISRKTPKTHTIQQQKRQPDKKMDRRPKQIFFKEDHIF